MCGLHLTVPLSPIEGALEPVKGRTLNSILPALEGMGKGQEWVEVALTQKKTQDWVANGYGLLLIPSFQEQVDRKLNKKKDIEVNQKEIARAFNETLGAGRVVVKVEKTAAERAQSTQGIIYLGSL